MILDLKVVTAHERAMGQESRASAFNRKNGRLKVDVVFCIIFADLRGKTR
jgi:hypothetical protein